MKKTAFFLSTLALVASSSLFATGNNLDKKEDTQLAQGQNQGQMMSQPDCTQLTVEEQNFANQLNDMTNKSVFCTQFTSQQRQQTMQMVEKTDASGNNIMTADQAVNQMMKNSGVTPMSQSRARASSGCPAK